MDLSVRTIIEGHLTLFLFALFLGLLACFMAWYRGYFKWSPPDPKKIRLPLRSLIMAFALYLSVFFLFPFLLRFISFFLSDERKESLWVFRGAVNSWIHIFEITLVVFFLFFYLSFLSSDVRKTVWGDGSYQGFRKNAGHFGMGVVTWLISFPIVIAVSQRPVGERGEEEEGGQEQQVRQFRACLSPQRSPENGHAVRRGGVRRWHVASSKEATENRVG